MPYRDKLKSCLNNISDETVALNSLRNLTTRTVCLNAPQCSFIVLKQVRQQNPFHMLPSDRDKDLRGQQQREKHGTIIQPSTRVLDF